MSEFALTEYRGVVDMAFAAITLRGVKDDLDQAELMYELYKKLCPPEPFADLIDAMSVACTAALKKEETPPSPSFRGGVLGMLAFILATPDQEIATQAAAHLFDALLADSGLAEEDFFDIAFNPDVRKFVKFSKGPLH